MNAKLLAIPLFSAVFLGCHHDDRDHATYDDRSGTAVEQASPTVVIERPPTIVEEGSTYDNMVVVAPADVDGYVLEDGQYYYWHPGLHVWVHVHRDRDWRPAERIHIYHHWREHPEYRREHDRDDHRDRDHH